jgi:hypothetical protein
VATGARAARKFMTDFLMLPSHPFVFGGTWMSNVSRLYQKNYETRKEQDFEEAILNLPDTFMEYQDDLEIH